VKRIKNNENFKKELKKILNSLTSKKLNAYLKNKKFNETPQLSLMIQEFIKGDVAGVIFSSTIKNGKRGILINSNFGDASSVVSGENSDTYFVSLQGKILEKEKKEKEFSLNETQIRRLIKIVKDIEKIFREPQDIEWTIKENKIYILQSRPITKNISEEILVWDNSNIAESYSGIVLPLTSSYIKYAYKITYIDLAKRSGISDKKIKESEQVFENLLGFFYGRVYYNMLNWYKMLTLYPGYRRNKENLDIMISAKSKEELDEDYKKNVSPFFKVKYYFRLLGRYPFFNNEVDKFKVKVRNYLKEFREISLSKKSEKELLDIYYKSINELLNDWGITVENDFLLMTYFGMLNKFCKNNKIEDQFTNLISNIKDVVSAKQVDVLKIIADEFNKHKHLVDLSKKTKYKECLNQINVNRAYKLLSQKIKDYLIKYGGRFANDLKLESEDLDTAPEYIIKLLSLYSNVKDNDSKNLSTDNVPKFQLSKKLYLRYLLKKIRFYVKQREELRLLRSQSFSIARKIFYEVGKRFGKKKVLENANDIFYLNVEEIIEHIEKKLKNKNFIKIVKLRKKLYKQYEKESLDDVFYTYGNSIESKFTKHNKIFNDFKGQGCSSGIITGRVKILETFSLPDKNKFDIIVTKHTDPGWTPLFGLCNGLIVEHGGLLSHAAIISRELNLPCIIGLKDATKKLMDGQTITLNGYTGEVKIHD